MVPPPLSFEHGWSCWQSFPEILFSDVMMMTGLDNLDALNKCRQVCESWKQMIVSCCLVQICTLVLVPVFHN